MFNDSFRIFGTEGFGVLEETISNDGIVEENDERRNLGLLCINISKILGLLY